MSETAKSTNLVSIFPRMLLGTLSNETHPSQCPSQRRPFRHHDGRPGCRHLRRRGRALLPDESEVEEEKNRSRRGIGVAR